MLGCAIVWFMVNHNTYFGLLPVFWHSYFTRYCSDVFKVTSVLEYLNISLLHLYQWVCQWKNFWKSVNICGSYGQEFDVLFFDSMCLHLYCLLVYILCFPTYRFFFTFSLLIYSLLIFSFENIPAAFLDRMLWKATKPGSSFLCFFVL